ncbi:uncharacterized protein L201_006748 [Kwoniella dendrophila CBS 6074]|uniref:Uncharacterized protein n=1 Tax=Kwoniella dendrophila CBS 6074 TaxID=1295534 RepID=A0AAX4K221_9TREE
MAVPDGTTNSSANGSYPYYSYLARLSRRRANNATANSSHVHSSSSNQTLLPLAERTNVFYPEDIFSSPSETVRSRNDAIGERQIEINVNAFMDSSTSISNQYGQATTTTIDIEIPEIINSTGDSTGSIYGKSVFRYSLNTARFRRYNLSQNINQYLSDLTIPEVVNTVYSILGEGAKQVISSEIQRQAIDWFDISHEFLFIDAGSKNWD